MILFKLHVDLSNLNCRLHIISLFIFSAIGCFPHWDKIQLFVQNVYESKKKKTFFRDFLAKIQIQCFVNQKSSKSNFRQKFDFSPSVCCPTLICWMICQYNSNCSTSNSNHHSTRKMVQIFGPMDNNKNHNNRPDKHRTSCIMIFS